MKKRQKVRHPELHRNRLIMAALIILSGVFVGFHGGAASYMLFYTAVLLPLLSLIYLVYVFLRFRIYQYLDHRVMVKGEKVPYRFVLANEDKITYTNVNVVFEKEKSTVENVVLAKSYCLVPEERVDWETTLSCKYRGEYVVGIEKVIVRDFLNLFEFTYGLPSNIRIQVLPRVVHLHQMSAAPDSLDEKRQSRRILTKPNIPDVEIRSYAPGDPMKRIHWKNSARQQTLLTRKYTEEPKPGLVMFLDLQEVEGTELLKLKIEDKLLEAVLAVADYFYRHGIPVRTVMEYNGVKEVSIHHKVDFDGFYQLCSEAVFFSKMSIKELTEAGILMAGGGAGLESSALFFCHRLSQETLGSCIRMREYGCEVTVFYIGEGDVQAEAEKFGTGIHFYRIWPDQDITEVLEC